MSNPTVSHVIGAAGADVTTYIATQDVKSSALAGLSLLAYGALHADTPAAASKYSHEVMGS